MAIKPNNIIFGVNEKPTHLATISLALQHLALLSITLFFPVMLITAAHGSYAVMVQMVQAIFLVMGLGTIVLSFTHKKFGTDYFVCMQSDPAYVSVALLMLKVGGLPLFYAANYLQSALQIISAGLLVRLRKFISTEIIGLVIIMLGVSIIKVGLSHALGGAGSLADLHLHWASCLISFVTLLCIVAFSVWVGKRFSYHALLVGLVVGILLSWLLGYYNHGHLIHGAVFGLPSFEPFHLSAIHWDFVLPMIIAVASVTLASMGSLVMAEKINDAEWVRPNVKKTGNGLFISGIGSLLSSMFGGLPMGVSASNVGLTASSGVTSRYLSLPVGITLVILSFMPIIAEVFTLIPEPVIGAMIIYVMASVIITGTQLFLSRMMDRRRVFTLGFPLLIGLAFEFIPHLERDIPAQFRHIVTLPLTMTTLLAILLNTFFQIGQKKTADIPLSFNKPDSVKFKQFIQQQGNYWGAMPTTMYRARQAVQEALVAVKQNSNNDQVKLTLQYDESALTGELVYQGKALVIDLEQTIMMMTSKIKDPSILAIHAAEAHVDTIETLTSGDKQIIRFVVLQ